LENLDIRPCKLSDLLWLDVPDEQQQELARQRSAISDLGEDFLSNFSRTIWMNRVPVACMGIIPLQKGTGEVWCAISLLGRTKYKHSVCSQIADHLKWLLLSGDFHRIQMTARSDWKAANRFATFLGFSLEGEMKQYSQDRQDYKIYGRVSDGNGSIRSSISRN
jgi:hypothetical protein